MNVSLEKKGNVDGIITVTVDAADYADKVKKELKRISDTHVIPGFRKGHVPMDQLRRRFGKGVKSDVINDMVYREVLKYITDNKLDILGEPLPIDVKEITLDDGDYTFQYEVGFAPELGEVATKEVELPYYIIEVSDEMRAEQDKSLRERLGSQVPGDTVDERALVKGAIMELNPDGTVKEGEDAIQVINGIVAPFYFKDKEEADKFLGKHVNDKVVFNPWKTCEGNATELSSMLNVDKDKAADIKADFEMAISEIIVLKPAEHDQEFFDNVFGKDKVHNEEEYTTALTQMIGHSLRGNSEQLFAEQTRRYFIDKYSSIDLPEEFLKKWLVARNEELTPENIDEEYQKMRPALIWELVRGAINKELDVKVEEADLLAQAKGIAYQQFAQYGMTNLDDETLTSYAKNILDNKDYRRRIAEQVGEAKTFTALKEKVTMDTKNVSVEEFKEIASKA
ncbi:MAG: trigger factor [Bacteroidales bacterium]|nr:trigger factor [Bacteroidales bacterium]